jgi:hypothetical protein
MSTNTPSLIVEDRTIYFARYGTEWWIALKPICEALGLPWEHYFKGVKSDPILGQLLCDHTMVAADGKRRKMTCLPERYIYGWLFQIQSSNPALLAFKRKCYDVLYDHFHGVATKRTTAIRERLVAERKLHELRAQRTMSPIDKQIEEQEAVIKQCNKVLRDADSTVAREQMDLFD